MLWSSAGILCYPVMWRAHFGRDYLYISCVYTVLYHFNWRWLPKIKGRIRSEMGLHLEAEAVCCHMEVCLAYCGHWWTGMDQMREVRTWRNYLLQRFDMSLYCITLRTDICRQNLILAGWKPVSGLADDLQNRSTATALKAYFSWWLRFNNTDFFFRE